VIYCKRFHPKNPFYEKVKLTTKRIIVLESFVTIGSFDYDCTLESFLLGKWEELQALKFLKNIYALVMLLFPSKPPPSITTSLRDPHPSFLAFLSPSIFGQSLTFRLIKKYAFASKAFIPLA